MSTPDDSHSKDRVVVEVRVVFEDGEESQFFTWSDVEAGTMPEIEPQDWMVQPRKSFPHPKNPIIYSMLLAPGREDDARTWLRGLRVAAAE